MSDHIPEAVLIDILARLTIEDLVRSICVCKSWYSLITSHHFVSIHMKQLAATRKNDLLLVRETNDDDSDESNEEHYSIHLHNDTFPLYRTLDFPFKSWGWNEYFTVVGSFNGVICLSDNRINITNVIILWNPSIRKSVTLPKPHYTFRSHGPHRVSIGFGFNSGTNDYNVVRVVYFEDMLVVSPPKVEVYELSVGSWRSVDPKGFLNVISDRASGAFLNGAVHWTGSNRNEVGTEYLKNVVSFDLRTEVFAVMKMPDSVAHGWLRGSDNICVSVLGESLALIYNQFSSRTSCVWVMKQYGVADSWTKQFNIDLTGLLTATGGLSKVCGLLKNEEVLVIQSKWSNHRQVKSLVSYEPNSKQMNCIVDIRNEDSLCVEYFVETLALLGVKGESLEPVEKILPCPSDPLMFM